MATIYPYRDGWRVQIRRRGAQSISKTFPSKAAADRWVRSLDAPATVTVDAMVEQYRTLREKSGREVLDTSSEHYVLKRIAEKFAGVSVESLDTAMLVEWCQERAAEGAGPYTINLDVSKLGTVIRHVKSIMALKLGDPVGDARPALHHFRLIGGGGKRDRRPTADELAALFAWFDEHPQYKTPMADIIRVCILCAFRRGEVCRLRWDDLDASKKLVRVRDRKDPRKKSGNDQWVPLLGEAWEIIQRQPRRDGEARIFPYSVDVVSKTFTTACQSLSIPDLHFHDMRHEAASALAEAGWTIPEIAAVTGHRSWQHLRRYVNIDPAELHKKQR